MKNVAVKNRQSFFHAVLLFGVLTGLLFSCGEGIRLLPFPASPTAEDSPSKLNNKDEIPYQFNVLRYESGQENYKSKSQHNNSYHWFGGLARNDLSFLSSANRQITDFSLDAEIFKSCLFYDSPGSRAPPFVL